MILNSAVYICVGLADELNTLDQEAFLGLANCLIVLLKQALSIN